MADSNIKYSKAASIIFDVAVCNFLTFPNVLTFY